MLLELVLTISSYPFGSLFSELGGHGSKLGARSSVILCLTRVCKSTKLEIRVERGLICQHCRGVTSSNAVAFTETGGGDMRANLSIIKGAINIEVTEDLLCFVCDDRGGDKISSRVINSSEREIFLIGFFRRPIFVFSSLYNICSI